MTLGIIVDLNPVLVGYRLFPSAVERSDAGVTAPGMPWGRDRWPPVPGIHRMYQPSRSVSVLGVAGRAPPLPASTNSARRLTGGRHVTAEDGKWPVGESLAIQASAPVGSAVMAELYVKPGNQQRGWNDPPQFSYGLQQRPALSSGLTQRGPFRKRVAAASEGKEPETVPHAPIVSRPDGLLVPQSVNLPPPPGPPTSFQRADVTAPSVVETDKEYQIDDVLSSLHETLNNCRSFVQKQVCDDIHKRLVILQEMWTQGKLSSSVRKRMGILTEELKSQHWDEADEIHRSLMVDHVSEVSQWMVGVKRLIAETKNLPGGDPLQ